MPDFRGTTGIDALTGGYGSDYMYGLASNDTLRGGYGSDSLYGDREEFYYDSPPAGGIDTLFGGFGNDYLYGDAGDDKLYGESGDDDLFGGAGKDLMDGGTGDDDLYVGSVGEAAGDQVKGGDGTDRLLADFSARTAAISFVALDSLQIYSVGGFTVTGVERYDLVGSNFNDVMTGWLHDDYLKGGAGADRLAGLDGRDTLYGGDGADTIYGGAGADYLYGDDYGQVGNDILYGENGNDSISGYGGNDKIDGGIGNDVLNGDDGVDSIVAGTGDDTVYGGAGADTINGGVGNDYLGSANSILSARFGDTGTEKDVIDAADGNDSVLVGVGDTAKGGTGTDQVLLSFSNSTVGVTYTLTAALVTLQNGTILDGFEQLEFAGGNGIDNVTGGALADSFYGGGGNDVMTGGAGDDRLDGEEGNDTLNGGLGNDTFFDSGEVGTDKFFGGDGNDLFYLDAGVDGAVGDAGNDTFYVAEDAFAADAVNGGIGTDTVSFYEMFQSVYVNLTTQTQNDGGAKNDRFTSIENLGGTVYDDVLIGNVLANVLEGESSDDVLSGLDGNDRLIGGTGSDTLVGGNGLDTFVLEKGYNNTYWPNDVITDFVRGTDKLEIDLSDFGEDVELSVGAGLSFTQGAASELHFDTGNGRLWFDEDGTGALYDPVLIATLNVRTLAATDFITVG